jgi:hypothetical protein
MAFIRSFLIILLAFSLVNAKPVEIETVDSKVSKVSRGRQSNKIIFKYEKTPMKKPVVNTGRRHSIRLG